MKNIVTRFVREDKGAAGVEYGLLVSLIAGAIIVTVTALGTKLSGVFSGITAQI